MNNFGNMMFFEIRKRKASNWRSNFWWRHSHPPPPWDTKSVRIAVKIGSPIELDEGNDFVNKSLFDIPKGKARNKRLALSEPCRRPLKFEKLTGEKCRRILTKLGTLIGLVQRNNSENRWKVEIPTGNARKPRRKVAKRPFFEVIFAIFFPPYPTWEFY